MHTLDDVFALAKELSCHDRWLLAHMLWESLPREEAWQVVKPSEEEIAELDRRVADVEAGRFETISGEVVKKFLRDKIDGLR